MENECPFCGSTSSPVINHEEHPIIWPFSVFKKKLIKRSFPDNTDMIVISIDFPYDKRMSRLYHIEEYGEHEELILKDMYYEYFEAIAF